MAQNSLASADRKELLELLNSIPKHPDYRWKLDGDHGLLSLRIEWKDPDWTWKPFGKTVLLRYTFAWEVVRELRVPTYSLMLFTLKHWPEFLEVEETS